MNRSVIPSCGSSGVLETVNKRGILKLLLIDNDEYLINEE